MQYPKLIKACRHALLICAIQLYTGKTYAQVDPAVAATLQTAIENMRTTYQVKGISAAAYIPGKGLWKGVTGESHAGTPLDTNMLLAIGSITKTFVAAEIMKLVENAQLSLSDTMGALLPLKSYINGAVTVKQLLGHTSGMGDVINGKWQTAMNNDPYAIWYFPTALDSFCDPPVGPPGSPFQYCNANYALLGMIVEAKKGDSLHKVLRNDLLTPNNLHNTHMEVFETYSNATAHNWTTPTLNPALAVDASNVPRRALWSSAEPDGGYFSDPADLAIWGHNLYSGKILDTSSINQMFVCSPVNGSYYNGYGLGVMRFPHNGRTYYGHGGNYFGYAGSMMYHPKDSICVAVLINQDCIASYEARILMDVLINKLTGIEETKLTDNINISPNPADKELHIVLPNTTGKIQVTVSNITGQAVHKADYNTTNISINTSTYQRGIYMVSITAGSKTTTRQVVVQH